MSKGIYIGLGSIIFLTMIGALALFNTWQVTNIEERLAKIDEKLQKVDSSLGAINNSVRKVRGGGGGGGYVASGGGGTSGGTDGGSGTDTPAVDPCPGNLLGGPNEFTSESTVFGGRLTRATSTTSKGYNIITENGADVQEYASYVMTTPAERNADDPDQWASLAAWCVQVNDDFTEYTIRLRNDIYWHPIQPKYLERSPWLKGEHQLTANDFKFGLDMILNEAVEGAAPLRTYYQDFDRIEIVDDFTFKAHWKRKVFQSKTFTLGLLPMAEWIYSKDPDGKVYDADLIGARFNQHWYRHMMGTGPYIFESFKDNDHVKMVKNNNYFGELSAFDEIVYNVVQNPDQRLKKLRDGELDYIQLSWSQYKKEVKQGDGNEFTESFEDDGAPKGKHGVQVFPRMVYYYLGYNADGDFFGDKLVRRAMTHSLDREFLLREVFSNLGEVTTGNFYSLSPEYNRKVEAWKYNLEESRRLLSEAGWEDTNANGTRDKNGLEFKVTVLAYGHRPEFITAMQKWKEDLAKVGVELVVSPVDWPTMQKKMNNKEFDLYTGGWGMSWESDPYQIWHSSQADEPQSSNRVGFRNKRADEIIEEARVTFESDRRIELFHEFHEIVHEEQPYTFFFTSSGVGAWANDLRSMRFMKVRPHDISIPWHTSQP